MIDIPANSHKQVAAEIVRSARLSRQSPVPHGVHFARRMASPVTCSPRSFRHSLACRGARPRGTTLFVVAKIKAVPEQHRRRSGSQPAFIACGSSFRPDGFTCEVIAEDAQIAEIAYTGLPSVTGVSEA